MSLTIPKTEHQHTRIIVRVDSHKSQKFFDISSDVVQIATSKTTKQRGKFQIHVVPRQNYINLIAPDDIVNIYFDPGDGVRGFVRTMFGYIDRIERLETVNSDGSMNTTYVIIGSDFQKAIEKTSIYFNQYLRTRLDERLVPDKNGIIAPGQSSGFGTALRRAGLTVQGTPADFVRNFLQILLGFAQQWVLPESYTTYIANMLPRKRREHVQNIKSKILKNISDLIAALGFDPNNIVVDVDKVIAKAAELNAKRNQEGFQLLESEKKRYEAASVLEDNASLYALRTLIRVATDGQIPAGILDLLNMDFIETLTIDGWRQNASVWQQGNQSLAQYLYGHCHEHVNELIFDLRPVSVGGGLIDCDDYSRESDELSINTDGLGSSPASIKAVKYEPSVIFREYPYSVVEKADMSKISVLASDSADTAISAGIVPLGPIFAAPSPKSGRRIYEYKKSLYPDEKAYESYQKPTKHIDVVKIDNGDVVSSQIGRSDEDTFNVFQLYANIPGVQEMSWREMLSNFSPLVNQISIRRHGLRLRELTTDFANYFGNSNYTFPRKNLVRWITLLDHWYQHSIEYLNGTITLRGMPEIRVGYRLDWDSRHESYYVDAVSHHWQYMSGNNAGTLKTTIEVSRGQRNDPYLAYIYPTFFNKDGNPMDDYSGNRSSTGRLAHMFTVHDTMATVGTTGQLPSKDPAGVGILSIPGTGGGGTIDDRTTMDGITKNKYELAYNGQSTMTDEMFTFTTLPKQPTPPKTTAKNKSKKNKGGKITEEILEQVRYWSSARNIPVVWVMNTILLESAGDPDATHIDNREASYGLMQINSSIHAQAGRMAKYGITVSKLTDIKTNIMLGTEIMRENIDNINTWLNGKPCPAPLGEIQRILYTGHGPLVKDAMQKGYNPSTKNTQANVTAQNWRAMYPRAEAEVGTCSDPNASVT